MSNLPPRPGISPQDRDINELFDRIAALEAALPSGATLRVDEDGPVNVDPTTELTIGNGLTLTNPSPGSARIDAGVRDTYIPVLTAATTDPSGPVTFVFGFYRTGNLVFFDGSIAPGAGFDPGVGAWSVSLPFDCDSNQPIGAAFFLVSSASPNQDTPMQVWGFTSVMRFLYPSTYPTGDLTVFDGSLWNPTDGGLINLSGVYLTSDP